jgi:hypothetical protein
MGALSPVQLSELHYALVSAGIEKITVVDTDRPAVGICECNSAARTRQFYTTVPGWLARSSSVSEPEDDAAGVAESDPETEDESPSDDASQSGPPKTKRTKAKES